MEIYRRIQLAEFAVPLVGYLVVVFWLALGRPRRPPAGAPVADLGGEPPGVVALLVNGWEVDGHALAATVLDLAARRYLEIEEPGDGTRIRLLYPRPDRLSEPERLVHNLIASRAALNESVPLDALAPAGRHAAQQFRDRFAAAVVGQARELRLSTRRPRDAVATMSFIWFAVFPAFFQSLLPAAYFRSWHWLLVAPVLWVALVVLLWLPMHGTVMRHEWSTPDGRRTATYWLGVKAFLEGYEVFDDLPSAAVTVWERYLAYGAALRCADRATDALAVLWTGESHPVPRPRPGRPVGAVAVRRPRSIAELTVPGAVRVGMITVLGDVVLTPIGSLPRAGTHWAVGERRRRSFSVNAGVLVTFVGMCCLFPVTLVLVPAMVQRRMAGTVWVTAAAVGGSFTTEIPFVGREEYAAIGDSIAAATGYRPPQFDRAAGYTIRRPRNRFRQPR